MSAITVTPPFPVFNDIAGAPLQSGFVYVGASGLNAEANQIPIFWDSALTIPALQPLRTINGYISRNGSPAQVYADAVDYSLLVKSKTNALIWSTLKASGISADSDGVVFLPNGTGAVATTVQDQLRKIQGWTINVQDAPFYAKGDGVTDDDAAINSAGVSLATGGKLRLPKANYKLSAPFVFTGQRLNIEGDGRNVSIVSFSPASSSAALEYRNPALGGLYQGSINNLGFTSGNSVDKTAIQLYNTADCEVHGIGIASSAWAGSGSIGIRTYGRQTLSVRNCQIACARPVVISQNPVFPSLNTDHFVIEHSELSTTLATGACIEFENGVMHTSTTLKNLALTGGKWGILWNDTTSVGASYALAIADIRTEQGVDSTGWSIDLQSTGQTLQTLHIKNAYLDATRNGIRLRNAQLVTLENVYFQQASGTQLDITMVAGSRLVLINCFFQTGGTKTITNGRCVRRSMGNAQGHTVEEWVFDSALIAGAEYSDVYHHGSPVSLAAGATLVLGTSATSTGFVFVSTSEDVSAVFSLMGPTNSTRELLDPDGFFSVTKNTAASYNIYHEAGNYILQNNRGLTATVSVFKMLTTA